MECNIQTPLLGHGNLSNLLAATAVALELGVELNNIVAKAAEFHALDRRGVVHKTPSGVILIDDSYNSSPFAFQSVLDVIAHDTTADRKIAVIGEMLELGERAITLHEECGQLIASAGLDSIFTVGGVQARALAAAAVDAFPCFPIFAGDSWVASVSYISDVGAVENALDHMDRISDTCALAARACHSGRTQ